MSQDIHPRRVGVLAMAASIFGFSPSSSLRIAISKERAKGWQRRQNQLPSIRESHAPEDFGRSAACARMVRQNKMRRLGIGGARI